MRTISLISLLVSLIVTDRPHVLRTRDGAAWFDDQRIAPGKAAGLAHHDSTWYALVLDDHGLKLATSPSWSLQSIAEGPVRSASIAAGEQVHVAWLANGVLHYRTLDSKPVSVPPLPNFDQFAGPIDLQLDSEGKPGLVFVLGGEGNSTGFWRPGRTTARVIDARGQESDDADVRLAFEGTKPRVFFYGQIDDNGKGVFLAKSSDDGVNWEAAFRIPSSGPLVGVAAGPRQAVLTDVLSLSTNFQRFTKAQLETRADAVTFGPDGRLYVAYGDGKVDVAR